MRLRYRHIPHTADVGLEVFGSSLEELFVNAAYGLIDSMLDAASVRKREARSVDLSAADGEELLVRWLSELLYFFDAEKTVYLPVSLAVGEGKLKAEVSGEVFDASRHGSRLGIKAVTYGGLSLERQVDAWRATVLFDV